MPQPAKAIDFPRRASPFDSKDDYTYSNLIRKKGEEGYMKSEPTVFLFFPFLLRLKLESTNLPILIHYTMRTSIRQYSSRPVEDDLLNELLAQAEQTQTMGNLQLYSVVVTRSDEMKQKLAPAHFNQPMVTGAPVVLTFCADYHRTTAWAQHRKGHPGYDNFLSYQNAATDALLFCQRFCDLAEAAGLGLCFLGTTVYQPAAIIRLLQLPQLVMPVATITLGWPAEHPNPSDRLPLSAIRHNETYQPVTAETIDRDYAAKEALPENLEFVRINQTETLAQIFTDIRYTAKDCQTLSTGLLEALRMQGFLD